MVRWLLVAVLGLAPLTACDGSGDTPDAGSSPRATSSSADASPSATTTDAGPVVECPGEIALDPDPALPDAVPDGATSVRLCSGAPGEISPPVDALTTGVTGVVQAVNGQRIVTRGCADRRLPTYQLAFGYPDGTTFVVAGRFTGCGELLVGSARRLNAQPAIERFTLALAAQRETAGPPAGAGVDAADLDCGQEVPTWTWRLSDPRQMTAAKLCFGPWRDRARGDGVVIAPDDLAVLTRSMRHDTLSTAGSLGCTYFKTTDHWIVGATAWGDPVTMVRGCGSLTIESAHSIEWRPRGAAKKIMQRLIAEAR